MRIVAVIGVLLVASGNLPGEIPGLSKTLPPENQLVSPLDLANTKVVLAKGLGPIFEHLVDAFSLDRPYDCGLVYVRPGTEKVRGETSGVVMWVNDHGRQCARLAMPGAAISVNLGVPLRQSSYTLAIWMTLPLSAGSGTIWDGFAGPFLSIQGTNFMLGAGKDAQIIASLNRTLSGWHHVGLTCDGAQTSVYFDGVLLGSLPVAPQFTIDAVGGSLHGRNEQCDLLDDILVFDRALTAPEMAAAAALRIPDHPPTAGEIAFMRASNFPRVSRDLSLPARPAAGQETAAAVEEIFKAYRQSLVLVSGNKAPSSGFLASYAKGNYLFTTAQVTDFATGGTLQTLNGEKVTAGAASIAVGHDVVLMQTALAAKPFEIMKSVDQEVRVGDDVVVLDNLHGVGPVDAMVGKIVGIGPDLVEIDAPFVPANAGSPIIHVKSGKVIGMAAHVNVTRIDPSTHQVLDTPEIRRFGDRLDIVKAWQPINWTAFQTQEREMQQITNLTADLNRLAEDLAVNHRVSPGMHTNPLLKPRIEAFEEQTRGHRNARDIASAAATLLASLKTICQSDLISARQQFTYDYFQRKIAGEEHIRSRLAGRLETDLAQLQTSTGR